jgi:transposase
VPIEALVPDYSLRCDGEDRSHVELLAEVDELPPILVVRSSMRVVDGMHRLRAAALKGRTRVAVEYVDGDEEEIFEKALQANVRHGLPLSRAAREAAVRRLLSFSTQRSDRAIAAMVGLSAPTVAEIRRREQGDGVAGSAVRVGRDGRVRPVNAAAGRLAASRIFDAEPEISLRACATRAGVSVGTARDVRERLRRGVDPVPGSEKSPAERRRARSRPAGADPAPAPEFDENELLRVLRADPSIRLAESGRTLLCWLSSHSVNRSDWKELVTDIPVHSFGIVARLAAAYAAAWQELADEMAVRAGGQV